MQGYKILIVDDIVENLQTIISFFEKHHPDYNIYQANRSVLAFEIAKKVIPDLIITDWDMPEVNGIDLIKQLKAYSATKDVPVIMATGVMLTSDDLRKALEAGAVDYIRKPFESMELIARTHSALMIAEYHKRSIDAKNHELAENALHLIKNNEFNIDITKKLQSLSEKIGENEPVLQKYLSDIIVGIDSKIKEDSWKRFNIAFQSVHADFNKNLMAKFPDLTNTELKLCAFLRLGMNTKDIASVLYQNPDSIKVSRSRLRKKLGLSQSQNLQVFLTSF